ncbi:MAG TPA: hypothetical protein VKB50_09390 [Vicinamibacterales bacterium]|nr:hypothetical protein [Vicinamibacterales bacterium]
MLRSTIRRLVFAIMAAVLGAVAVAAQAPQPQSAPPDAKVSALAPSNLAKPRQKAPFDLTGNWFIDNSPGIQGWLFGPAAIPKLKPEAQKHRDAYVKAIAEGKVYRDDIGQCWPAGVPIIMTRVWPIAMIQLPTAIYMVSEFMNSLRVVYLDGRTHTDPDIVVRTFNGESIGRWDGDTLVVETKNFTNDPHHWIDQGVPASDELKIIERIRMINNGRTLEINMTLTDPKNWEGEWTGTRRWNRVDDIDLEEVECLPDLNEHLQSTSSKVHVR